jgi:hypothetical protein
MKNDVEERLKIKFSELTPVSYDAQGGFAGTNFAIKVSFTINLIYFGFNLFKFNSNGRYINVNLMRFHNGKLNLNTIDILS